MNIIILLIVILVGLLCCSLVDYFCEKSPKRQYENGKESADYCVDLDMFSTIVREDTIDDFSYILDQLDNRIYFYHVPTKTTIALQSYKEHKKADLVYVNICKRSEEEKARKYKEKQQKIFIEYVDDYYKSYEVAKYDEL